MIELPGYDMWGLQQAPIPVTGKLIVQKGGVTVEERDLVAAPELEDINEALGACGVPDYRVKEFYGEKALCFCTEVGANRVLVVGDDAFITAAGYAIAFG